MTEKQRTLGECQEAVRRTIEVNSEFDGAFLAMNALALWWPAMGCSRIARRLLLGP
jgi:hypothetical protein